MGTEDSQSETCSEQCHAAEAGGQWCPTLFFIQMLLWAPMEPPPAPSLLSLVMCYPQPASQPAQSPFRALPGKQRGQVVFSHPPPPSISIFIFFFFQHFLLSSWLLPLQSLFLWCPFQACSLGPFEASFLLFLPPPQAACPCLKFRLFRGSPICCSLHGAPTASYRRPFPLCAVVVGGHIFSLKTESN